MPSSIPSPVNKTSTPPLQDTPSRYVSSEDANILIILPMMLLMLLAVIGTHKEQHVFPDDMTMNTVRSTTVLKTISSASPSSTFPYEKLGKRKELCLQRQ